MKQWYVLLNDDNSISHCYVSNLHQAVNRFRARLKLHSEFFRFLGGCYKSENYTIKRETKKGEFEDYENSNNIFCVNPLPLN